jgi:hypothetical protein
MRSPCLNLTDGTQFLCSWVGYGKAQHRRIAVLYPTEACVDRLLPKNKILEIEAMTQPRRLVSDWFEEVT